MGEILSAGSKLSIKSPSGTYDDIAYVTTLGRTSDLGVEEVTPLSVADFGRQFKATLFSITLSVEGFYDSTLALQAPSGASGAGLIYAHESRAEYDFKLTLADSTFYTFSGIVNQIAEKGLTPAEYTKFSASLKVNGVISHNA